MCCVTKLFGAFQFDSKDRSEKTGEC